MIHDIVFHSQGGYKWDDIYNMPIWLRKFTYDKMKEYYNKQNEEVEKAKSIANNVKNNKQIATPNISQPPPTYSTKGTAKK